jgi:hypothetical protein
MRKSEAIVVFHHQSVPATIRKAAGRKEYRLKDPDTGPMRHLVLEVMGGKRASWRFHYDVRVGTKRVLRKMLIGDDTMPMEDVKKAWKTAIECKHPAKAAGSSTV